MNPFDAPYNIIVVLGPTASGKTALAVDLAQVIDAEIISADSRQVYRKMDIGTGKDLSEYGNIAYHLIDIIDAGQKYNVAEFQIDFANAYNKIKLAGKKVILCGGTGMYIDAVLKQYTNTQVIINETRRQELELLTHEQTLSIAKNLKIPENADLSTHKRTIRAIEIAENQGNFKQKLDLPLLKPLVIGLNPDVETRRENIAKRLNHRLNNGLIEEVEHLLSIGVAPETLTYYGLEYKFVMEFLKKSISITELETKLCIAIQQYAKRQMTFFRSMERKGLIINWINF